MLPGMGFPSLFTASVVLLSGFGSGFGSVFKSGFGVGIGGGTGTGSSFGVGTGATFPSGCLRLFAFIIMLPLYWAGSGSGAIGVRLPPMFALLASTITPLERGAGVGFGAGFGLDLGWALG